MQVSVTRFTIENEKLIADLSDLGPNPFHRIYPDAADAGITVQASMLDAVSFRGASVDFYIAKEVKDSEGDLQSIELLPTPESIRLIPSVANLSMTLFND